MLTLAAAAAAALMASNAQAQVAAQSITITGRASANNAVSVAGFGDAVLWRSPFSATVINTSQLSDAGITSIADLTRLDAGITDAYNAPGYWGQLAVRGYTLDNRFNYRRDGLPINAETAIPQANKQSVEVMKGLSGLQAGTSAPGGLVNLIVKRPQGHIRSAALTWSERNNLGMAVDLGDSNTQDGNAQFGWRLNADYEKLNPSTRQSSGHRKSLSLAADAQVTPSTLVEAEVEWSHQQQPSTPGFSLLGGRLPDAKDIAPRTNLNNQPWSLPVVFDGRTASLRITQTLSPDLRLVAHAMRQRLDTDDRVAFPYGCSAENNYDRYCSDGTFDLYDFRSEGERRTTDALDLSLAGRTQALGMAHEFNVGALFTRYQGRFNGQANNWVGVGRIDGSLVVPAEPSLLDTNTQRDERSTELHLQDRVALGTDTTAWLGLRHSRLDRRSMRTDGSRATGYQQSFTTPWMALSHHISREAMVYLSWGQGVESDVTPNKSIYRNAGEPLPALKSRQTEIGFKHHSAPLDWTLAAFDIRRPQTADQGDCAGANSCTHAVDGQARHRGLEAEAEWRNGPLSMRGSATVLRARIEGSSVTAANGLRPTNVPASSLKLQAAYHLAAVPGLAVMGFVSREGQRMVLPDNSVATPGWTRTDLAARYTQQWGQTKVVWRTGVDNALNARAWKEAPYQYAHAYLYPLAPRSLHLSINFSK